MGAIFFCSAFEGVAPKFGLPKWGASKALLGSLLLSQQLLCSEVFAADINPSKDAAQAFEQAKAALSIGEQEKAELLLERVLMLNPDNAEARLELAGLFAKRGRILSAKLMLESLEFDPRTPEAHRLQLRRLIAQLPVSTAIALSDQVQGSLTASKEALQMDKKNVGNVQASPMLTSQILAIQGQSNQTQLELGLGKSTNPLARTSSEGITFTLPEGPVQLPLSLKPVKALARSMQISRESFEFANLNAGAELFVQSLDPSGTTTPSDPAMQDASGQTQAQGQATLNAQTAVRLSVWGSVKPISQASGLAPLFVQLFTPLQWYFQAQQGQDGLKRHSLSLAYPFDCWGKACRAVAVQYQEPTTLDRQGDKGQALRLEHKGALKSLSWLMHVETSASQVFAQGYTKAGFQADLLPWPQKLPYTRLSLHVSQQNDTHGYSPLLLDGAKRQLFSSLVAIEQQANVEKEKVLIFRAFRAQRQSNLELFNYKDVGFQISLRQLM